MIGLHTYEWPKDKYQKSSMFMPFWQLSFANYIKKWESKHRKYPISVPQEDGGKLN